MTAASIAWEAILPIPHFREDGWLPVGHHNATWEEVLERFGGPPGSQRSLLTTKLLAFRDALRSRGVIGVVLLDGSYVSAKDKPKDFDVRLIGPPNLQGMKNNDPELSRLLDAALAEQSGYTLFYISSASAFLEEVRTFWDLSKAGVAKGSLQVTL